MNFTRYHTKVNMLQGPHELNHRSTAKRIRTIGQSVWPVEPLKTDKREKHTRRHGDPKTVVTNILCENRRFRKVIKDNRGI